jgi:2,6-dihydroxypseudooxynicotine hydrolase
MQHAPKVDAIWRRWGPRFIGAGVDYNIFMQLKGEIEDWLDWCQRWSEKAADLEEFGDEAMEKGYSHTAAESWLNAAILYHFGGMYFINDMEQFHAAHMKKLETFMRAAPLLDPPVERFEVPFEGVSLVGLLRRPEGVDNPPVVIFFNGFEGVKEESHQRTHRYLARGMATVTWDGPGRGEVWEHLPLTGESGPSTSAIIDYLEARGDVDASRIGVTGPNRGGFAAAKAAAYEPRIMACAVTNPGFDRRDVKWDDPYEVAFDMHLFHCSREDQLRDRMKHQKEFTLEGDAEKIRCSVLIVAGKDVEGRHARGTQRLFDEVQGPKQWVTFPRARITGNNVPYKIRPTIADFMAEELGAG